MCPRISYVESRSAAHEREQNAFGEHLPNQAMPWGSQGQPHGHLRTVGRPARQ